MYLRGWENILSSAFVLLIQNKILNFSNFQFFHHLFVYYTLLCYHNMAYKLIKFQLLRCHTIINYVISIKGNSNDELSCIETDTIIEIVGTYILFLITYFNCRVN